MLLSVGLWHMLHVDSQEAFGKDLKELGSAVRAVQELPDAGDSEKARSTRSVLCKSAMQSHTSDELAEKERRIIKNVASAPGSFLYGQDFALNAGSLMSISAGAEERGADVYVQHN